MNFILPKSCLGFFSCLILLLIATCCLKHGSTTHQRTDCKAWTNEVEDEAEAILVDRSMLREFTPEPSRVEFTFTNGNGGIQQLWIGGTEGAYGKSSQEFARHQLAVFSDEPSSKNPLVFCHMNWFIETVPSGFVPNG